MWLGSRVLKLVLELPVIHEPPVLALQAIEVGMAFELLQLWGVVECLGLLALLSCVA